jgi:hypothetical protein
MYFFYPFFIGSDNDLFGTHNNIVFGDRTVLWLADGKMSVMMV